MRVIILGTGAMACLFGARLSTVADVTLVGRWLEAIDTVQRHGVVLDGSCFHVDTQALGTAITPADLVLVLVKAWQTRAVSGFLPALAKSDAPVITLQNGLGNLDELGPRATLGVTTLGATLLAPGHVRSGGAGPTHVAAPHWVAELFRDAGFEAYSTDTAQISSLLWGKLAVNCAINPLTALLRVRNGELLELPAAGPLMDRAARECADVAHAKRIELPFPDACATARAVARATALNQSSMLQDIVRGAPTEIDAINGAVVNEAAHLGLGAPVNDMLSQLVRAKVQVKHHGKSV